jgi:hypothetical protein
MSLASVRDSVIRTGLKHKVPVNGLSGYRCFSGKIILRGHPGRFRGGLFPAISPVPDTLSQSRTPAQHRGAIALPTLLHPQLGISRTLWLTIWVMGHSDIFIPRNHKPDCRTLSCENIRLTRRLYPYEKG